MGNEQTVNKGRLACTDANLNSSAGEDEGEGDRQDRQQRAREQGY